MALGSAALAQAQDAQQTVVFTAERAPPEDSQGLRQAPVDADLDPLAPNRWQRVSGQVGVYVVPVGDFISSLQLRLIFPAEGVERASVEEAGQTITSDRVALPRFAGDSAACASPTVTSEDPILVCPIPGSPWLDVMWLVQFGECTESATLTLRGAPPRCSAATDVCASTRRGGGDAPAGASSPTLLKCKPQCCLCPHRTLTRGVPIAPCVSACLHAQHASAASAEHPRRVCRRGGRSGADCLHPCHHAQT